MNKYITTNRKGIKFFNSSLLAQDLGLTAGSSLVVDLRGITFPYNFVHNNENLTEYPSLVQFELKEGKSGRTSYKLTHDSVHHKYMPQLYQSKVSCTFVEWMDEDVADEIINKILASKK